MSALGRGGFVERVSRGWRTVSGARAPLSEFVPYLLPLGQAPQDPDEPDRREIILTRAGGLLVVAALDPPDLESASATELVRHVHDVSATYARLSEGVSLYHDQWRLRAASYLPETDFGGNAAAQRIDASRRRAFENLGRPVYGNRPFLAVHQVQPQREVFLRWLRGDRRGKIDGIVQAFREGVELLFQQLQQAMRGGVTVLTGDHLAGYLHATINYQAQAHVMLPTGMLATQLASSRWSTVPLLQIDGRHVATVEVLNWGNPTPTLMDVMHEWDGEYRWVTTIHTLDPDAQRKEIELARRAWRAKQKGVGAYAAEIWTKNPWAARTNPEADRRLDELDGLEGDLPNQPFGIAHLNIHVQDETREGADDKAVQIAGLLRGRGLLARPADLNATLAPLADMPGNVGRHVENVRRTRIALPAAVKLAPVTGVSTGHRVDERFGGAALLAGVSRRKVPFFWSLNQPGGQDAHALVVGRTGAGKSSLLALMAAQFLRYEASRVVLFDRLRSFRVPCLCLGGTWLEPGSGAPAVQILRAIDEPAEFTVAHATLMELLRVARVEIDAGVEGALTVAMRDVAALPPDERTLTSLYGLLGQNIAARDGLRGYLRDGPYGALLDGAVPGYGTARVIGVDTEQLLTLGDVTPIVVFALFQALRREVLTTSAPVPKLFLVDEAWSYLKHPLFAGRIEQLIRETRKLLTALVLATQNVADLHGEVGQIVSSQVGNRVYLPDPRALTPEVAPGYTATGLTPEQIRLIAHAQPAGDYLLQTPQVTRLMSLKLEDDALAICGASTPMDQRRADALLAQGIEPGVGFTAAWLAEATAAWWEREGRAAARLAA